MIQQPLEQPVRDSLSVILEQYGLMNRLADEMLAGKLPPEQWQETADKMKCVSLNLERMEKESQAVKNEYQQHCRSASAAIIELQNQLASSMQSLLMKVSRLEQMAARSKEALLPQIHAGVKAIQMKNAYGKYA